MAGYIRQDVTNNIADGNVINASDFDNEYNAIEAAFHASTGHTHDGTAAEGAPITKIGPTQDIVASASALTPKTDNTVDLGSSILEYKDLWIDGTANIDSLVADTADINAGTIDGVSIGSAVRGSGAFTTLDANGNSTLGDAVGDTVTINGTTTFVNAAPTLTPLTASQAVFTNGSKTLVSNAITGTGNVVMSASPTLTGTISAAAATLSSDLTLSAGTANGVLYLNGSKVATSGSALTFDGQTLTNTRDTPILNLNDTAASNVALRLLSTGGITYIQSGISAGAFAPIAFTANGGGSEQMRLTSTGLGIGTSSPSQKLDVRGNVYVQTNTNPTNAIAVQLTNQTTVSNNGCRLSFDAYNIGSSALGVPSDSAALAFYTGGVTTERMRLDSSGNLGLGVTPSAWGASWRAFQITTGSSLWSTASGGAYYSSNVYFDGTNRRYVYTGTATEYEQSGGVHKWSTAASGTAGNTISFTQAMTLDASGNLGLGVTPSAWGNGVSLQGSAWALSTTSGTDSGAFTVNARQTAYGNGSQNYVYRTTAPATNYEQTAGIHRWYTAPSGTAGTAITFTQAMTLDASGNLGVGTTSPGCRFNATQAASAALGAQIALHNNASTAVGNAVEIALLTDSGASPSGIRNGRIRVVNENVVDGRANMQFWTWSGTTDAERARITSGGAFLVAQTAVTTSENLGVTYTGNNDGVYVYNVSASPTGTGITVNLGNATGTNVNTAFLYKGRTAGGDRFLVYGNGGIANYQANDVNLSDRREKTNFAPAKSYLDTICAIPVQTFEYIDQSPDDPGLTLGVVAQDVQAVAPELVMESNWGTEDNPKMRLSIYQTDLQYALMKCIQEQQELIKDLRARVAALEAK